MAPKQPPKPAHATDPLEEACARNAPAELHFHGWGDRNDLVVLKSRVLDLDEKFIYFERPDGDDARKACVDGRRFEAFLVVGGMRFSIDSEIVEARCLLDLNAGRQVIGFIARRPGAVEENQRRRAYRANIARCEYPAEIHLALDRETGACPLDGEPRHGLLLNLSVNGAAVVVEGTSVPYESGDPVFVCFGLPDHASAITLLATVRQRHPLGPGSIRLGIAFEPWPSARDLERTQDHLGRYITQVQREQIKRAS